MLLRSYPLLGVIVLWCVCFICVYLHVVCVLEWVGVGVVVGVGVGVGVGMGVGVSGRG